MKLTNSEIERKIADKIHIGFDLEVYEVSEDSYESVNINVFSLSFLKISIDDKKVRTTMTTEPNSTALRFKKNCLSKNFWFCKIAT